MKMKTLILTLFILPLISSKLCANKNSKKNYDNEIFSHFYKKAPFALKIENTDISVLLEKSGLIKPLEKDKNNAIRIVSGSWKIEKKHLILDMISLNSYSCEIEPCHVYRYIQKRLLVDPSKMEIKGTIFIKNK